MSDIEFDLAGLAEQLRSRLLAVPLYQRPYAWKEEQIAEYWSDLAGAFGKKIPEYFMGTIVLTRHGTIGRDTIIDGQQRLATTAMLVAAIRDAYRTRGDTMRAEIVHGQYLVAADLASGDLVPRLRLSSEDDLFFKTCVIEGDQTATASRKSHERIRAAYLQLRQLVGAVAETAGGEWPERLVQWIRFAAEDVKAIVLEVPTEADAFLIFETLNDRGADLTIADLLKNYLFGRAGDQLDTVRDGWLQAVGSLEITSENATFTMFLRHYWSSRRGTIRERDLFKDIRENVSSATQAVTFVDELQKAARYYASLLNSDHEQWAPLGTESKQHIETFLRLELEQVRPLMLAAMQHFTPEELKRLLRALTAWGVRGLFVGGIGGGTYERAYCEAAVKIRKGELKTTDDIYGELAKIIPSDEEFGAAVTAARVPRSNQARYFLIALEKGFTNQTEPELVPNSDEEKVNLEHVLPKNATETDWGSAFTLDERKDWPYRLGNLALLQKGPNGRIGNKPFQVKQPILQASTFLLTQQIGAEPQWTASEIAERQTRLAVLAQKVWSRKPN